MAAQFYKWLKIALFLTIFSSVTAFSTGNARNTAFHPFYVSVFEMEHNASDKTLELSCKVFTDDFEKAMARANNTIVDILKTKDKVLLEKQIADYIRKHLQIKIDGKIVAMEYVGYETESQFTLSYFQLNNVNIAPKKIEILVNVFHELYDKQINILHISSGGNRKSTKLDYPATSANFEF